MARLARLAFVAFGIAVAFWLLPASIHIVDWTADGPSRIALFAPLWQLLLAIVVATIAILAVSDTVARGLTPFALLWLWAVPYLPWIPDRAPILLLFAGPLRWGVLAVAVGGSVWTMVGQRVASRVAVVPGRRLAFAVSLAVYLGFGLWSAGEVGPGADEPHYLVITQSLLRDHDLAIENNHQRGDYHEYFSGDLKPDFLRRGLNEVIYSIHAPGLPALLVPAYAIAGYTGAVVTVCLFGALAALAIFDLAMLLTGSAAAWFTWAAVALTVPFMPHAWLIFPEIPGALVVAWAALWLIAPLPVRARTWIWRGLALGLLPWLHTKFVILLAAMLGALCVRVWRDRKAAAAVIAPAAVSVALWIYSFYRLYGELDPQVPYGDFPRLYVLFANIPRGVLGLLFDQKFGLLVYAPVYLMAIAGGWFMARRAELRLFGAALLTTIVAFVASSTRMYMWWGGSSAPARFLVPVLPLAAPFIAVAFHEWRSAAARGTAALLLTASLAVAIGGAMSPRRFLLFSAPHGLANLIDAVQGDAPLTYLLPTFTEDVVRAPLMLLAPWGMAALFGLVAIGAVSRGNRRGSGVMAASTGVAVFVVAGAILAGRPSVPSQQRAAVLRGRLALMHAYDGDALRGFDYARRATLDSGRILAMSGVRLLRTDGELRDDADRVAGPIELPAGRFTARLRSAGEPGIGSDTTILLGGVMPIASGAAAAPLAFDVPFDAGVAIAASTREAAAAVQEVDVTPESIVPKRTRADIDAHAIEPIASRRGAYVVYADGDTYPEHGVFWTRGTRAGRVFVAPAGAATLVLTLHVGPAGGLVRVSVGGQDHSVTLPADRTQQIEIALEPAARLVPIVVQAPAEFRPSEQEPGSTDRRSLGCQVRIELR